MLTASQIVMGMAAGLFAATAQATAVMLAGPEHRAKAVAAVVGGTTFAVALGAPLGSLIGNLAGWRATFLFVGLLAVLCAAVLALMLPRGLPGVKLTLAERMLTIGRPGILPSLVVTFLYLTGGFRHHLLPGAAGDRGRRPAGDGAAGDAARLRRRRGRRQLRQRPARRPARRRPASSCWR